MIWNYLLVSAISFLFGFVIEVGWLHWRGHRVLVPFISSSSRNITIAAIAVAMMSLLTIVNVQHQADRTAECDKQFREALKWNTDIAADQRRLDDEAREKTADRRKLLDDTFSNMSQAITRGDSAAVRQVIADYNAKVQILTNESDKIASERAAVDRTRKPYPEPTCGMR